MPLHYVDLKAGDTLIVAFRTERQPPDTWRVCGTYRDQVVAKFEYDKLIKEDLAAGATVGCRWRLSHHRDVEHLADLADKHLTRQGLVDLVPDVTAGEAAPS